MTCHPKTYDKVISELKTPFTPLQLSDFAAFALQSNHAERMSRASEPDKRVAVGRLMLQVKHISSSQLQQMSQTIQVKVPQAYSHPLSGLRGAWYGLTLPHSIQMLVDILNTHPQYLSGYLALRDRATTGGTALAQFMHQGRTLPKSSHAPLPFEIPFEGLCITEKVLLLSVLSRRCIELQYDIETEEMLNGRDNFGVMLEEINEFDTPTGYHLFANQL